nr:sarcosine oxidase subunit gamma family protein [uncultured Gellertiella sp.]
MTDLAVISRPALASVAPGRFGANAGTAGIVLEALAEGHVLHLLANPKDASARDSAAALATQFGAPLRVTSPGQWYLAGDRVLAPGEFRALETRLAPALAISDQSHGRVRIGVSGTDVEAMLAKLMAADLALAAFPVDHGTTLFAGHVAVHAFRTCASAFELMVLRGFAVDLWESLVQASLEFGVECKGLAA